MKRTIVLCFSRLCQEQVMTHWQPYSFLLQSYLVSKRSRNECNVRILWTQHDALVSTRSLSQQFSLSGAE
jgi:hypothetical protein